MQLDAATEQSARLQAPRHSMAVLSRELGALVDEPDDFHSARTDRLGTALLPPLALWSLARRVRASTGPGDAVFCLAEAGGLQFAAVSGDRLKRPKLAVFVHNVDRPRARLALKLWRIRDRVDVFFACSAGQVDFLRRFLRLPDDRVRFIWDHTDTRFFTPGPASAPKPRPIVVSVGLEQRDYKTLAAATQDLDLDVRISGFSSDAAALARTFPEPMPANMSRAFYPWPALVQLYRDADVVVVSCHENKYAAGVQSLKEGKACGRPVVATSTSGLAAYLDPAVVLTVPPADAAAMRAAILKTLSDPTGAAVRAAAGHRLALQRHDLDRFVGEIAAAMRAL
jgi:glycosyltransferase involved in cell wall biosynthesis